jgi:hypothetical protein
MPAVRQSALFCQDAPRVTVGWYYNTMSRKAASRRKPTPRKRARRPKVRAKIGRIFTGDQALHELFREQAAAVLDDADIGEEEKQSILLAMSCSCCGAGSMSFSVKMKPKGRFVAD